MFLGFFYKMIDIFQISLKNGNNSYNEEHEFISVYNIKNFYDELTDSKLDEIRHIVYKNDLVLNKVDDLEYKKIKATLYNKLGQKSVVYLPKTKSTINENELRLYILQYMQVKSLPAVKCSFEIRSI